MADAIPLATYRLQLTSSFTFDDAAALAPYLRSLGITHLYVSPFLQARQGSTHGYDVVDHASLNPELGGEAGFARFSAALKQHDLGLILDFVPNHMGVHHADNAWWLDVLEWGERSPWAVSFDIDWDLLPFRTKPALLLPILGASYGETLEKGEIVLRFDADSGSFSAWYFDHRLPIAPERYSDILRKVVESENAANDAAGRMLLDLAARYTGPRNPNRDAAPRLKQELASLKDSHAIITNGLSAYRAGPEHKAETLALHLLLERQHYHLAHWRLATSEINYRRFFDVNSLAGLRIEDRDTFERVHALVRRLIANDEIQGLRLDHIDGLRDPAQYFVRLRRLIREAQGARRKPFYLVVEKILAENEALPRFVGISGTTGYEWLNVITQVLVERDGLDELDEIWRQASNSPPRFAPVLRESKRRVLETLLASEFTVLVRLLARIAAGHYSTRDYSEDSLRQALELFVMHCPVYRTYITAAGPSPGDRALIERTVNDARKEWFGAEAGIFDFLRDALMLDLIAAARPLHSRPRVLRFALKVQQFTGPLMAKAMEDTAFYRYPRLLALNEVGGRPDAAALSIADFHATLKQRAAEWPHGLTATATHDTKRGEDARTRLVALTELASDWAHAVGHWKTLNAPFIRSVDGQRSPSIVDEYFLYQTLIGALPPDAPGAAFIERIKAYMQKALREAKLQTSWLNPHAGYEQAVSEFIEAILDPARSGAFIASLRDFGARTSLLGALNALTQLTLKATMPGIPDFYQGTELWDLSLVDPDNRRPVDFSARAAMLHSTDDDWRALARDWKSGRIKFAWTRHLLRIRHELADVFTLGDYVPLAVSGRDSRHVIAFVRRHKQRAVVTIALRSFARWTNQGREWPKFDSIDAQISLNGFALYANNGSDAGNAMELAAILKDFPVKVLPARLAYDSAMPVREDLSLGS